MVLDRLDHHVKEVLRVPGYARYMDEFARFADRKRALREAHAAVADYLRVPLGLDLKHRAAVLAPAGVGLPFLGWWIFRGTVRLQAANERRVRRRLRARRREHAAGRIDEARFLASLRAITAHLAQGDTRSLRRRWLERGVFDAGGSSAPATA